jgi:6-phosphofructo-2-kinase
MRLKLSGPDYRDQDPVTALADFKKRVSLYEQKYVPLGDYEERNNMPYIQVPKPAYVQYSENVR